MHEPLRSSGVPGSRWRCPHVPPSPLTIPRTFPSSSATCSCGSEFSLWASRVAPFTWLRELVPSCQPELTEQVLGPPQPCLPPHPPASPPRLPPLGWPPCPPASPPGGLHLGLPPCPPALGASAGLCVRTLPSPLTYAPSLSPCLSLDLFVRLQISSS